MGPIYSEPNVGSLLSTTNATHSDWRRRTSANALFTYSLRITDTLEEWAAKLWIHPSWRILITIERYRYIPPRTLAKSIRGLERLCREGGNGRLEPFEICGTPEMYDYDLIKCWFHFQGWSASGHTFPPEYTQRQRME